MTNDYTQHQNTHYQPPQDTSRPEKSAAASSASSPGRRAITSPPGAPYDTFAHHGTRHTLIRLMPGAAPIQNISPHQPVQATVNTLTGKVRVHGHATGKTEHFTHVVWSDDTGDVFGTWCPRQSTTPIP